MVVLSDDDFWSSEGAFKGIHSGGVKAVIVLTPLLDGKAVKILMWVPEFSLALKQRHRYCFHAGRRHHRKI